MSWIFTDATLIEVFFASIYVIFNCYSFFNIWVIFWLVLIKTFSSIMIVGMSSTSSSLLVMLTSLVNNNIFVLVSNWLHLDKHIPWKPFLNLNLMDSKNIIQFWHNLYIISELKPSLIAESRIYLYGLGLIMGL